jgi:transposase
MEARIERFRKAVATYFGGRAGRGARYPEDLQEEAVVLARSGMLSGKSLGSVARELGVGSITLTRWLQGARETLRPVEVQEEESGEVSSLALVAPSGWRIEGLRLEDLPKLLRVLG